MRKVKNKWNGNFYTVVSETEKSVRLQREDLTELEIAKSEFYFSYTEQ